MDHSLTVTVSAEIKASPETIWQVLTTPEKIKIWLMGTETVTSWTVGSPIHFQGEWNGQKYRDGGTILEFIPNKILRYSYWSGFSGMPDSPENYSDVKLELHSEKDLVKIVMTQTGFANEDAKKHSETGWAGAIGKVKELAEG